jgi:hypothetical protein
MPGQKRGKCFEVRIQCSPILKRVALTISNIPPSRPGTKLDYCHSLRTMATAEVVKKKGRPKKIVADAIDIGAQPVVIKVKKPRVSRKSTLTSPTDRKDDTLAEAQALKKHEPLPLSPGAVQRPKSRSTKSVATETGRQQLEPPSTPLEPSLILKQATAFVESMKEDSLLESSNPVKIDPQTYRKEFKPAGTLPAFSGPEALGIATPGTLPQPRKSLFLTEFFTEPILAEQPAWSRSKKPATVSALSSASPEVRARAEIPASLPKPDTSALLSSSSLPVRPKFTPPNPSDSQIRQHLASTANLHTATSPQSLTQPEQQIISPIPPQTSSAEPASQTAMPTGPPTETTKPTPTPQINAYSQNPRRVNPLSKMPPRVAGVSGPKPLKPTEMPYEVLKHDPKFRALSRRWTSLIVAIPLLVATSYALYGRYTETTVQRRRVMSDRATSTINGGV